MKHTIAILTLALAANFASAVPIITDDFAVDPGTWTLFGTTSIANGRVNIGSGGNNRGGIYRTVSTTAGQWYRVTYDYGATNTTTTGDLALTLYDGTVDVTDNNAAGAAAYGGQYYRGTSVTGPGQTAWFQAASDTTTISFRDFSYSGASYDVRLDNIVVDAGTIGSAPVRDEYNIAPTGTISQSSYLNPTLYEDTNGVNGIVNAGISNDFMHTGGSDYDGTYTLTFSTAQAVTKLRMVGRAGFNNRVGNYAHLYDVSDGLIATVDLADTQFQELKSDGRYWAGVKKVVIEEDAADSQPLNFTELEVYTVGQVNVAPLGTATASTTHGSWGVAPAYAIDESTNYDSSTTVFHSAVSDGGDWWQLDLDEGYTITTVEIQARNGSTNYLSRMGNTLEFLDINGDVIAGYDEAIVSGDAVNFLLTLTGNWEGVFGVRITETDNILNLAEVRLWADTSVAPVPEPATMGLLVLGGGVLLVRRRRR